MGYDIQRKKLGREPCWILELDIDKCGNTYGVAPCTASIPDTGDAKCYNTRVTCQDVPNYNRQIKTYRYSSLELDSEMVSIPSIKDVSFTSTQIDPGRSLGIRASVVVTLQDESWGDLDTDPYVTERDYIPKNQGTYWGKFLARNPYYQNRMMRVRSGYLGDSIDTANFQTRLYLIDRIEGPNAKGVVKIYGVDVLRLIDDKKSQAPFVSNGVLSAAIIAGDISLTLSPVGIGDLEYPDSGVAAMGEEIVNFSRTGDVVTLNLRGAYNTQDIDHDEGETFQLCKVYDDVNLTDVLYDLITTYGFVDPAFIDKAQWDLEAATWLSGHQLNAIISEPTGINALVNEIIASCLCYIWWDDIAQLVQFRAIRPEDPAVPSRILNDDNSFIADSLQITEDPSQRISQVWCYYSRKNPLLKMDELRNWAIVRAGVDADAESDDEYGEQRIKKIFCRFFSNENQSQAVVLAARMLARYRDNPRTFKFKLDAKDADIVVGDVVNVSSKSLQSVTGAALTTPMQILKRTESKAGTIFDFEVTDSFFEGRYAYIMADDTPDYLDASAAQRNKGLFICDSITLKMPNGDPPYKII